MSLENVVWPDSMIRDWKFSNPLAANQIIDSRLQEAATLDFFIRNRGAVPLHVSIEGMEPVTVDPGDLFKLNDTVLGLISILSTVQYDLFLTGVKFSTLRARGLI